MASEHPAASLYLRAAVDCDVKIISFVVFYFNSKATVSILEEKRGLRFIDNLPSSWRFVNKCKSCLYFFDSSGKSQQSGRLWESQ